MAITVRLVRRAASHSVRLEVHYPGLEPPTDLFDDLSMIGWRVPAPEPPPAHAIDWSAPGTEPGSRYRITPWDATAIVEPPVGTGWHGSWTAAEAGPFLATLRGVLGRHGVPLDGDPFASSSPATTAPSPPRGAPPPLGTAASPGTASSPATREATPSRPGSSAEPPGEDVAVRVQFVVEDEHTRLAAALLNELGIHYQAGPATLTCTRTYRGRSYTVELTGTRFDFVTDRDRQRAAVDWLVERVELPVTDPMRLVISAVPSDEIGLAEVLPMLRAEGAA